MENKEIKVPPILKNKWIWAIVVVIAVLIIVMSLTGEGTSETGGVEESTSKNSADQKMFNDQFDNLCDKITGLYSLTGTVTCQDDTTWTKNHEINPEGFPYEYRDINVDFGEEISYEIKVVRNPDNIEYFREHYTCKEINAGSGSCIVDLAKDNIIYSIIFYNQDDQKEITELSDGLKTILSN